MTGPHSVPQSRRHPSTAAARAISKAKQNPTMANVVDALDDVYGEISEMRNDVAILKGDVVTLKGDVGKLLHHFGLASGSTP